MKISAVLVKHHKRHGKKKDFPTPLILSILSIVSGFLCGTLFYCFMKESLYDSIFELFISFFTDFTNKSSSEIISGLILSELPYIFIMFVFSFCVIGFPFTLFVTFVKSLAPTLLFSHLYCEYALKGAEYVFLVLLIGEAVNLFGTLLMTQGCFHMSSVLYENLWKERGECREEIKSFSLKFALSAGTIILSNVITFVTVTSFNSLFSF